MSRPPGASFSPPYEEISRLNSELANLHRELTLRNRELERLREGLEEAVRERTSALEKARATLERELAEHRRTAAELAARERTERQLLDGMAFFAALFAPDGTVLELNETTWRAGGQVRSSIIGKHPRDTPFFSFAPEAQERIEQAILEAAAGETVRFDTEVQMASGVVTVDVNLRPVFDETGRVKRIVASGVDVTEREQARRLAAAAEERYRTVVGNAPVMIWAVDRDGRVTLSEGKGLDLLDVRPGELVGRRLESLVENRPDLAASLRRVLQGETFRDTVELGGHFFEVAYEPLRTAGGEVGGAVGVATDVSERVRAERELRSMDEMLELALDAANIGLWYWDAATNEVYYSPRWKAQLGYVSDEIANDVAEFLKLLHPDDRRRMASTLRRFAAEPWPRYEEEFRLRHRDGRYRWFLSRAVAHREVPDRLARVVGANLDITERREAEQKLRDYARELGGLSRRLIVAQETERRRVARELHDQIGQVLTAVKLNLKNLARRLPGEPLGDSLEIVDEAVQQVRDLSLDLRPSLLDDLGLVPALRWQLDRVSRRAGLRAWFRSEVAEDRFDAGIETAAFRVVQEALTNVVRHAKAEQVWVQVHRAGGCLEVEVRDDGCGFDVADTKGSLREERIGLAGMEERVLLAGGRLELRSRRGYGTTVRAIFPAKERPS